MTMNSRTPDRPQRRRLQPARRQGPTSAERLETGFRLTAAAAMLAGAVLLGWAEWVGAAAVEARRQSVDPGMEGQMAVLTRSPFTRRIVLEEYGLALSAGSRAQARAGDLAQANETGGRAAALFAKAIRHGPVAPNAWIELARQSAQIRGAGQSVSDAIAQSYETGPNHGWISERRVRLALSMWFVLPREVRLRTHREIVRMAASVPGRQALATVYLGLRPEVLRKPIETALADAPVPHQKTFVAVLKEAAGSD